MDREGMLPGWLDGLVGETTFFAGCGYHEGARKKEKNIFCLHCSMSICTHCAPSHPSHPLLQVRRYVYNDVVQLDDLQQLIDCSFIKPNTINGAKVVSLKPRPTTKSCKSSNNICLNCDRNLHDFFRYCSLACKVDHLIMQGTDIKSILFQFDESKFKFGQLDSLRMDGSDMIDDDEVFDRNSTMYFIRGDSTLANSENNGKGYQDLSSQSNGNRRKRTPRRSPQS